MNAGALRSLAAELGLWYGVQPVALRTRDGLARELASLQEGKMRINTLSELTSRASRIFPVRGGKRGSFPPRTGKIRLACEASLSHV